MNKEIPRFLGDLGVQVFRITLDDLNERKILQFNTKDLPNMTLQRLGNYVKKKAREKGISKRAHMYEKSVYRNENLDMKYKFCFLDPCARSSYVITEASKDKLLCQVFKTRQVSLRVIPKKFALAPSQGKGNIEDGRISDALLVKTKMQGDSPEERERAEIVRKCMEDKEKLKEKRDERKRLAQVRKKIEDDRERGRYKNWSSGKNSRYDPDSSPIDQPHLYDERRQQPPVDPFKLERIRRAEEMEARRLRREEMRKPRKRNYQDHHYRDANYYDY